MKSGPVPIHTIVRPVESWNPLRANPDESFSYIDLGSVDQERKVITEAKQTRCGDAPSRARQLVKAGDILVSTVRPNLNGVAQVPHDLDGATASTGFCVLRPDPTKADPRYLMQWVKSPSFIDDMVRKATGASYPAVSDRIVGESLIPLPPLGEQHRIAAILDRTDALRAKRRATIVRLDELMRAIFIEMFGNPISNPKGWTQKPFEDACPSRLGKMLDQKKQSGQHVRTYIRNANVQWFHVDVSDVYEMDFDHEDRQLFCLKNGDLLICEGGEPGRAAIWHDELPECYYQKAIHRGRPNPSMATAEYLAHLLWFLSKGGGLMDHITSATIAHLTSEKLKAIKIPLPPLALQKDFSARLAALERVRCIDKESASSLDSLFASLQDRAFRGAL